jgi:hypothetical protein
MRNGEPHGRTVQAEFDVRIMFAHENDVEITSCRTRRMSFRMRRPDKTCDKTFRMRRPANLNSQPERGKW